MGDEPQLLKDTVDAQRVNIEIVKKDVRALMGHRDFRAEDIFAAFGAVVITEQHAEMKANIMLAYRHLEDARMRLGKVLQVQAGGVSCYDETPVGVEQCCEHGHILGGYCEGCGNVNGSATPPPTGLPGK